MAGAPVGPALHGAAAAGAGVAPAGSHRLLAPGQATAAAARPERRRRVDSGSVPAGGGRHRGGHGDLRRLSWHGRDVRVVRRAALFAPSIRSGARGDGRGSRPASRRRGVGRGRGHARRRRGAPPPTVSSSHDAGRRRVGPGRRRRRVDRRALGSRPAQGVAASRRHVGRPRGGCARPAARRHPPCLAGGASRSSVPGAAAAGRRDLSAPERVCRGGQGAVDRRRIRSPRRQSARGPEGAARPNARTDRRAVPHRRVRGTGRGRAPGRPARVRDLALDRPRHVPHDERNRAVRAERTGCQPVRTPPARDGAGQLSRVDLRLGSAGRGVADRIERTARAAREPRPLRARTPPRHDRCARDARLPDAPLHPRGSALHGLAWPGAGRVPGGRARPRHRVRRVWMEPRPADDVRRRRVAAVG